MSDAFLPQRFIDGSKNPLRSTVNKLWILWKCKNWLSLGHKDSFVNKLEIEQKDADSNFPMADLVTQNLLEYVHERSYI